FLGSVAASNCTLHVSSTADGLVRTHTSPSPQPSPLGRGRTISHRSTNQGPGNRRTRAQRRSLSPRERVGVRGKQVCERELASEASDACGAFLPPGGGTSGGTQSEASNVGCLSIQ